MRIALRLIPKFSEPRSWRIVAFSFVRTVKIPRMESRIPTAAMIMGAMIALNCIVPSAAKADAPSAAVASIEPQ